jgi:hypothetical protein
VPVNPHEWHIAIEGSATLCQSDEMHFQAMHPKWVSVGTPAIEIRGSCIPRRPSSLNFKRNGHHEHNTWDEHNTWILRDIAPRSQTMLVVNIYKGHCNPLLEVQL